jgi:hypothetical protein
MLSFHKVRHLARTHHHAHLVRRQPSNNLRHLRISVDPEALVLGHTRQLHVLAVQLLLHDLLQCLEHKHFSLGQGERLVKFVLQLCLCTLGARSNGFGVVAVESAGGFCVVPVRELATASQAGSHRCVTYRLGPSSS